MKKRLLLLIGVLFILTGCTAEVTLNIDDGKIAESISIDNYANGSLTLDNIKNGYRKYIPISKDVILVDSDLDKRKPGVTYYNYSINELNNGYRINYSHTFLIRNYKDSRVVNEAFNKANISTENNVFKIDATNQIMSYLNLYPDLSKVTVKINSKYQILDNNADSCSNNTCTWVFTQANNSKGLLISLKVDSKVSDPKGNNNDVNGNTISDNNTSYDPDAPKISNVDEDENLISDVEDQFEEDEEKESPFDNIVIILAIIVVFLLIIVVSVKKHDK